MNINNAFPSKYLKSGDIPEDADLILTIKEVVQETVGQGEEAESKPIVYFQEQEKGLVLNKTNATAIMGMYGPETNGWVGKRIAMFATEVDFAGKQTLALRVRLKAPKAGAERPVIAAFFGDDEHQPEVWDTARAKAELEAVGLTADDLRAVLKERGRVNSQGAAAYVPARDTEIARELVAANTPAL